ncbi:MAG TPA: nuclear transport factor 2 family protein [Acidobacteriota bacterium]|nr:nuclear transport factor 2 family protein [Acidobacteriota bacterium]
MRKMLAFTAFLTLVITLACQPQTEEAEEVAAIEPAAEEQAVAEVLDDYMNAVELEDMDYYASVVDQSLDNVFIGAGADGYVTGWDALAALMEAQNEAFSDTKITQSDLKIHLLPDGKTAWATSLWDLAATVGEQQIQLPVRCTWILEKRDGEWKIVHFHKSVGMQK